MKMRLLVAVLALFCAATLEAQTNTFSLVAAPVALPGNHQTVAGTVAGVAVTVTANLDLREDNILAPGQNFEGFFGGFNYRLPILSTKVNNVSSNLNGYRFQFYVTGSAGTSRISPPGGTTAQHYAFLAGGGVQYALTSGGAWTLGIEVRYAKLPGLANNTAIVSAGPSFHF